MTPEVRELFEYTLSKQAEWGRLYREQEARRKLEKNRAEKKRVKDKIRETIANDVISKVVEIKGRITAVVATIEK